MLVYDITQEKTFDNISKWLRNIEEVIRTENNLTSKEWVLSHYDRYCSSEFNPLTPGAFGKKCGFWTSWWLDLGQISFNLVETAFCNTPACLATTVPWHFRAF